MNLTLRQAFRVGKHHLSPASYRDGGQQPSGTLATMMPMRKMTASNQVYSRIRERDEERHAQEHSHTRDDVDKMFNFRSDGVWPPFQPRSQGGNSAHHGSIPGVHNNATCAVPEKSTGNCTDFISKCRIQITTHQR